MYLKPYNFLLFVIFSSLYICAQNKLDFNYKNLSQVNQTLNEVAKKTQGKVIEIGKSRGGLPINVLQLGSNQNPAILLTAGLDGNHPSGVQLQLLLLEKLAADANLNELLKSKTIYFLPVGSPDAFNAFFNKLQYLKRGNALKTDDDRNGEVGDDPYDDLNKDGYITLMRVEDASGNYIEHPDDNRLVVKADANKQQVGKYLLFSEGLDNNKDGQFNEDAAEGVNVDQNFAFDYQIFQKGAGIYAASEPETKALMDFLMDRPQIHSVINFGLQDNLSEALTYDVKKAKERIITAWQEEDVAVAKQVHELYKKTKIEAQDKLPLQKGGFSQTAYYHAGRFSFSTPAWYPVTAKDSTEQKSAKKDLSYEQKFLKWADQEKLTQVFVPWQTVNHPDFEDKKVEVGGIIPYALWNPPLQYLEENATVHKDFIIDYIGMLPKIEVVNPKVEKLDNNLYRVTVTTTNKGFLPTSTKIGDKIRFVPKIKIELALAKNQKRLAGQKYVLNGPLMPNESVDSSWLISGSGSITITAGNATTGLSTLSLNLK